MRTSYIMNPSRQGAQRAQHIISTRYYIMQKAHLHLIKWAVKRGYSVAVYGEGEFDGIHHTYKEIKDNVEACDMGEMLLLTPSVKQEGKWKRLASFAYMFEYEQAPDETIYDYAVNDISEAWSAEYNATA